MPEAYNLMNPHGIFPVSTWVNFKFVRSFCLEETMAVWPVTCFGWKPQLLIPDHFTSDLPTSRWQVKKAPYSLAHGHAGVVRWAARGNTPLVGSQGRTRDPPRGKSVTYPLGHGGVCAFFRSYCIEDRVIIDRDITRVYSIFIHCVWKVLIECN